MEALGINLGYLIVQLINIVAIYLFMRAFAIGPITKALASRRERIARGEENARLAEERLANAEAEAQQLLDGKRAEAQQIVNDATRRAEEAAKAIEEEARADAKGIVEKARADAESERNRVLSDMRGQVAALSMAAASRIIGEGLDSGKHESLINEFFGALPAEAKGLGGKVTVTTALPLSDAEQKAAQKHIGSDDVEFLVDPTILGGAVVRSGDQIVDGSVRNQIGALRAHLQ